MLLTIRSFSRYFCFSSALKLASIAMVSLGLLVSCGDDSSNEDGGQGKQDLSKPKYKKVAEFSSSARASMSMASVSQSNSNFFSYNSIVALHMNPESRKYLGAIASTGKESSSSSFEKRRLDKMRNAIEGNCLVEYDHDDNGNEFDYRGFREIEISGSNCPISLTSSVDWSKNDSYDYLGSSFSYNVVESDFEELNDIVNLSLAGSIRKTNNDFKVEFLGTAQSQVFGKVRVKTTSKLQITGQESVVITLNLSQKFKTFSVNGKVVILGKGETVKATFYIDGGLVSEEDFLELFPLGFGPA